MGKKERPKVFLRLSPSFNSAVEEYYVYYTDPSINLKATMIYPSYFLNFFDVQTCTIKFLSSLFKGCESISSRGPKI